MPVWRFTAGWAEIMVVVAWKMQIMKSDKSYAALGVPSKTLLIVEFVMNPFNKEVVQRPLPGVNFSRVVRLSRFQSAICGLPSSKNVPCKWAFQSQNTRASIILHEWRELPVPWCIASPSLGS